MFRDRALRGFLIVFAVLMAVLLINSIPADRTILRAATALFFLMHVGVYFFQKKKMSNANPHAFLRAVTGSMMIKMLVCAAFIITYVLAVNNQYQIGTILGILVIYVFYLAVEVRAISRLNSSRIVQK